jgi:hypothetical protein
VLRSYPQDEHASIDFDVPHGKSEVHLGFTEGVSVVAQTSRPLVGDASVGLRLVSVHLVDRQLTIVADVPKNRDSHIDIRTRWEIADTRGSSARRIAADMYELDFASGGATTVGPDYMRATATVMFRTAH